MITNILLIIAIILIGIAIYLIRGRLKPQDNSQLLEELKQSFQSLSFETLSKQTEQSGKTLDEKERLIGQQLANMKSELEKIQSSLNSFNTDSQKGLESVKKHLELSVDSTNRLQEITGQLKEVLKSSKARGQWGERMAEDVLNLSGFIENVNYKKQKQQDSGSIPDFTFLLPQDMAINMDVKFPFDSYMAFVEAKTEVEKNEFKKKFLVAVREKIKQVTTKDYINPEENTVDYVLLFIPNEQVYAFINESDRSILDEAMKKKVIMCSPLTLYAILAVIRQAMENFNLEKTAKEILMLLSSFNKQWGMFIKAFEGLGKKLSSAQDEYNELVTTRKNQLEKPLREIEMLREQKGIEGPEENSGDSNLT